MPGLLRDVFVDVKMRERMPLGRVVSLLALGVEVRLNGIEELVLSSALHLGGKGPRAPTAMRRAATAAW
jgi:hypothetical protein